MRCVGVAEADMYVHTPNQCEPASVAPPGRGEQVSDDAGDLKAVSSKYKQPKPRKLFLIDRYACLKLMAVMLQI